MLGQKLGRFVTKFQLWLNCMLWHQGLWIESAALVESLLSVMICDYIFLCCLWCTVAITLGACTEAECCQVCQVCQEGCSCQEEIPQVFQKYCN